MAEMKATKKAADRGVVVENPMPDDLSNIKLGKAEFVAKEIARKEKELKIKEFAKTLDEPKKEAKAEVKTETPKIEKPRGRPRKIE
jgi:hypothetical protein